MCMWAVAVAVAVAVRASQLLCAFHEFAGYTLGNVLDRSVTHLQLIYLCHCAIHQSRDDIEIVQLHTTCYTT